MGGRGPGPQPARSLRWEFWLACGFSLTAWMCCSSPGDSGLMRGGPSVWPPAIIAPQTDQATHRQANTVMMKALHTFRKIL